MHCLSVQVLWFAYSDSVCGWWGGDLRTSPPFMCQVELIRRDYVANGGWETFLSYEDPEQGRGVCAEGKVCRGGVCAKGRVCKVGEYVLKGRCVGAGYVL